MVFITIYKKNHLQKEDENPRGVGAFSSEKPPAPRGVGDLVLVFKHDIKVMTYIDGELCKMDSYMDKKPFMFIPLIDDGIDECIYLPKDIPPEDMLFIEHLLPQWYHINNVFRNETSETIENFLLENEYEVVENNIKQNELYEHVVETLCNSKVLLDGGEYHKKIIVLFNMYEMNGITFIPEDPEILKIKKDFFSS